MATNVMKNVVKLRANVRAAHGKTGTKSFAKSQQFISPIKEKQDEYYDTKDDKNMPSAYRKELKKADRIMNLAQRYAANRRYGGR
jgi:hypothetical protein